MAMAPVVDPTRTASFSTANIGSTPAAMQASINAAGQAAGATWDPNAVMQLNPEKSPAFLQAKANALQAAGAGAGTAPIASALSQWSLEGDPIYQQAIAGGQSAFNTAKAGALYKLNANTTALNRQNTNLETNAWDARRQLAGNYAARGMQRGEYGAYYRAQDAANAQQVAAQTDIKDQIDSLNNDFLTNYGTTGADWLGTSLGQQYRQSAIQLALQNRLGQVSANG